MTLSSASRNRKPAVIMLCDDPDELSGVVQLITAQIYDFRVFPSKQALKVIKELQPKVVLFALSEVNRSVKLYTLTLKKGLLQHHHIALLLAQNNESEMAFKLCTRGLFEDYFIYRPLYERFRLNMLIHNAVKSVNKSNEHEQIVEEFNSDLDNSMEQIVLQAEACKNNLNPKFAECKAQVEPAEGQTPDTADMRNILNLLEGSLKADVDKIIDAVVKQKQRELKLPSDDSLQVAESLASESPRKHNVEASSAELNVDYELSGDKHSDKKQVLVVEDNTIYREQLVNILENDGLYVDQADNGKAALLKIKREDYDLVLMDLFLPRLNGLNTTKQIKGMKDSPPPIIAITGNTNKDVIKSWVQEGLKGYIIKPSTRDEILAKVHQILG